MIGSTNLPLFGLGDSLLLSLTMLAAVAGIAALIATMRARREGLFAARIMRERSRGLAEFLKLLRIVESDARLGIWQYDPATGQQEWSDGLKRLFGIEESDPMVEGAAETFLCAHRIDLLDQIAVHAEETGPYEIRIDMTSNNGRPRLIGVRACNLFRQDGSVERVIAVLHDMSEEAGYREALAA